MKRTVLSAVLVSLTLTSSAFAHSTPSNQPQAPGLMVAHQAKATQAEATREAHKAQDKAQAAAVKVEEKAQAAAVKVEEKAQAAAVKAEEKVQEKADKTKAQADKARKELAPKPGVRRGQTGTTPAPAAKTVATDSK